MALMKIYTDGGMITNPGDGCYGFAIIENDCLLHEVCEYVKSTTNNRMEILGVLNALLFLKKEAPGESAIFYCDSQYVVNGINKWMNGWSKKLWSDVKNPDLWKQMHWAWYSDGAIYRIEWVRGHNGDKWNEYVDNLCGKTLDMVSGRSLTDF